MTDIDTDEWTRIRIEAPLPTGVAGTLMQMIGTAWPEAMVETTSGYDLTMRVPKKPAQSVDDEFIRQLGKSAEEVENEASFLGFRDGWVAFAPPKELCLELGNIAHAIFKAHQPQAINHVEWAITTGPNPDDPSYVLSISVAKDKTPLAMRLAAEARVEALEAELAALRQAIGENQ